MGKKEEEKWGVNRGLSRCAQVFENEGRIIHGNIKMDIGMTGWKMCDYSR